ncbi:uncharacterized protein LOC121386893 isoform X2 [Gigantopelta aegis]|uniref:uncharacterized protein LOC121386893 isoform X2 n=1 Tax=Gigantopelta aegis TaxID=1735272 RepID=UPI001B88ABD3|nr:uncharacterized protein LOC121386893 isoform X2 [Gigantopelta aegis]
MFQLPKRTRTMKLTVASVAVFASVLTVKRVTGGSWLGRAYIACMEPGIEGQKTELKCTVTGTVRERKTLWIAPFNKEVVSCDFEQSVCTTSGEFTDRYTGVINTPEECTLIIESFDPKTDAGTWACRDPWLGRRSYCEKTIGKPDSESERTSGLSTGAISGIVIAVVLAVAIPTGWIIYRKKEACKR